MIPGIRIFLEAGVLSYITKKRARVNAAISSGFHGKEFKDIVDQLADEESYMRSRGITIDMTGMPMGDVDEAIEVQRTDINLDEDEDN